MKNLIFLILILFTACTENEMDNKLETEVLSELNYESTYQFSPDKKYSRGIPIIAHNGVAYLFEEKKEGVFNNALIMLPQVREDISKLDSFLKEAELKNATSNHVLFTNNQGEKCYFVVMNEEGHELVHKLKEEGDEVTIVYGKELSHWYGDSRFEIEEIFNNSKIKNIHDLLLNQQQDRGVNTCSSGGPGATSCSIDDPISGCSVSCASGYYACCSAGSNNCYCVEHKQ